MLRLWMLLLLLALTTVVDGCSCLKRHPQEHYCTADFVVLAHVKRLVHNRSEYSRAYKVRIKKEFKMSEAGRLALSYGRILTPSHDASCGIRLKAGRRYVLTGTINQGKPWINLCNWNHDWDRMTAVQRKGFRKLYRRGCDCKVMECHWWGGRCPSTTQACTWRTAFDRFDCQEQHAICIRNHDATCRWSHSRAFRQCNAKSRHHKAKSNKSPTNTKANQLLKSTNS